MRARVRSGRRRPRRCRWPAPAAPPPSPVAAQGAMPARCAISAMPATAHTFPGRYLPRLETVQIRAAPHPSSSLAPAREHRCATPGSGCAYMRPYHDARSAEPARRDLEVERLRSERLPVAHQAPGGEADDGQPDEPLASPQPRRAASLRTQRLAIPALALLGDVLGREPRTPRLADEPGQRERGRGPAAGRARRRSAPRRRAA